MKENYNASFKIKQDSEEILTNIIFQMNDEFQNVKDNTIEKNYSEYSNWNQWLKNVVVRV